MGDLKAVGIKACPREISRTPNSFTRILASPSRGRIPTLAYLRCGDCSFLLQNFYHPEHAGNLMMHLLVADVEAWWQHAAEG